MAKCSDPTYEDGPITPVDLKGFDGTLEPPFNTPIAQAFADKSVGFLSILDGAFVALEAEQTVDVTTDILSTIGGIGSGGGINADAAAQLTIAESGFAATRASAAELRTWVPDDVLTSQFSTITRFHVQTAAHAPIAGATVTIDVDIGKGHVLTTDASGVTPYFTVPTVAIVGYDVAAAGFAPASGTFNTYTDRDVTVTLS